MRQRLLVFVLLTLLMYALLTLLLLTGCVSSSATLAPALTSDIPEGASVVTVHSTESPEALYRSLYQHLATEGCEIKEASESMISNGCHSNLPQTQWKPS